MEYQYKLIISNRTLYKEFEIMPDMDKVKLGTVSSCEFRLNPDSFFADIEMLLERKNNAWTIDCSEAVYLSKGDMRRLLSAELVHGDVYSVRYASSGDEVFELRFMIDFEAKVPNYNWYVNLDNLSKVMISANAAADIILRSQFTDNSRCCISKNTNGFMLEELNSDYGVYVNGQRISKACTLQDHDFFSVAEFSFYYKQNRLYFDCESIELHELQMYQIEDFNHSFQYPLFNRNTRIRYQLSDKKISILDAPTIPSKPHTNIVTSLMPSLAMLALIIVVRGFMSSSSGTYVIFSACSMGMGIITTILSFMNGKKQYKQDCKERFTKYTDYVEKKKLEVANARQKELDTLNHMYCDVEQDVCTAVHFERQLFERTREDEDFLSVYLGQGTIETLRTVDYKKQDRIEVGDELTDMPEKIHDMFEHIDRAPIRVDLKDGNAVGIVGTKQALYGMLKNMVIDLAVRQYYGDVRLFLLVDDEKKYNWIRLLPHLKNEMGNRNIVFNNESKNNMFESLFRELTWREQNKQIPYYGVVLVENEFGIKNHPISRYIENASKLGITFVFLEKQEESLPLHCSEIIKLVSETNGEVHKTEDGTKVQQFEYRIISDEQAEAVVRILAPVYCEEISLENSMRKNITLFELLHVFAASDLNLTARWNSSQIYKSMAAPLGVNAKDEVVDLNLHEKFHGPHGLVAGTTGSGKSEILQSYILSAATLFHPYEIGFVIIDFKGGGMVNQFKDLPHLIGAITNIDGNEVQRSLKSIRAELMKRQTLFADAGVNHIDKYIQLFKEHKVNTALPHLVIIVDEFAELKAEQPEFMKELISTARIGRSLGVHLILATQKPSGVVDSQIWSNSKFKLCLKVQSKEDSNEVLKTPLAAEIKEPGRAYLQVGNNEIFELFQSAFSGAPATMDENENSKEFVINQLNFAGRKQLIYKKEKKKRQSTHSKTQLEAIVDYIAAYCEEHKIARLSNICMPPLSKNLIYEQSTKVNSDSVYAAIGILDDPDHQRQDKYQINLSTQNFMLIGSAQCGKTNVLQTMIRSMAENYTPDEVNMYIVDFSSMILKNFEEMNHVGGVVCVTDDDKLKNLFKLLNGEIVRRKQLFAEIGVSSFVAYKESGRADVPQIVVFIDNLTALREMYLVNEDFLLPLCRDGVAAGVSFVIANAQTSGIGFRYLNNFEGRMTLFCNETTEYNAMFEGNRMKLPNIPGRALVQINKNMYECQTYLSFEGGKEFERVQEIQKFVEIQSQKYHGQKALKVPEIPKNLSLAYIEKNYPDSVVSGKLAIGLDYASMSPVGVDFAMGGMLSVAGKADKGKDIFVKYVLDYLISEKFGQSELFILDDMTRKWKDYEFHQNTAVYSNNVETASSVFEEINQQVQRRYNLFAAGGMASLDQETWIVVIVEGADTIAKISGDKAIMAIIKNLVTKYKNMKVLFLNPGVDNSSIPFNAPDYMKAIKDSRRYLIFDDASNIKLVDVPTSIQKKYAKPLELFDAYYICDNELMRVKTVK